ncbi:hypothetical protein SAMN05216249_10961 [Acetitomaculum ruminis DSM 5522]|uniref:Transcription repressor NadR n=1 Tax=Acetitomaculum ruminis DSM 5522 TaxID=1120918 RepID=A0A1I0Y9V9_9FIRM|nr:transcription repressor NadR [Acetitomaculum ruminis]SFB10175.1 hypothetical protein SAMN05216249_10961 [Acetitomaculum ruminis DSM 5522]
MKGKERRNQILKKLSDSSKPVSGTELAREFGVSRQVIVQDIALLRANGCEIFSTNLGYVLNAFTGTQRVFKVHHTEEETEEELNLIVDYGGIVKDVFVYHKAYGVIRGELNIKSRADVQAYIETMKSGRSSLLMNVTDGYHYHTVSAENEGILEHIFQALGKRNFLADLQDYEPVEF